MLSSEPSRKKPKLSGDVDKYQESSKSKELVDNKRDPANATDTCGISKAMHSSSNKIATTLSTANKFTVFVIDTDSRLFATEVMGSQQLWSIVEELASRGCSGVEEGTLLHCRGQIQQDVHQTADEAQLREGYTISLAKPGCTQRWEAFAEMESVFYELYDFYQVDSKVAGAGGCIARTDDTSEMCRRASEVQHKFLGDHEANHTNETRKAKLLSFLEADCVPVLSSMSDDSTRPADLFGLDKYKWAACTRLVCIEGYAQTAMWFTRQAKDVTLFPWIFFLTVELTLAQCGRVTRCADQRTCKQLQKLGELLEIMRKPVSSWSDLLPPSCFDASAQHHTVRQLVRCVTATTQVVTHGLKAVKKQVTDFTSRSIQPDETASGLEVAAAWGTMVEVLMALQAHLTAEDARDMLLMLHSFLNLLKMLTETCLAVERFAAACIRLGIPPTRTIIDPFTQESVHDPNTNPYTAAIPQVLREHLTALLPGILALSHAQLDGLAAFQSSKISLQKEWLPAFLTAPVAKAILKVADLKPQGVLHCAATSGSVELQQYLPEDLRRKYLHELFPDLSVEANFEEEPDQYSLVVPRDDIFAAACRAHFTRGVYITFKDEMGQGSGVMKTDLLPEQPHINLWQIGPKDEEWLTMVTKSFFGEQAGVFQQCPEDPATVHPVREHEGCGWEGPEYIRKAGVLAGLAICYRCPIGIRLSKACLKMMTGRPVSLDDFQEVDPQLYRTLRSIESASEEELQAMDLTFESPEGEAFHTQQDEPVGLPVTVENREKYVECLYHYFFDCSEQVGNFLEGLASTSEWQSWNPSEDTEASTDLKLMLRPLVLDDFGRHLSGTLAPLDVTGWRQATVTPGFWYETAAQDLEWFWQMVTDMDDTKQRQLLSFWTSMSTVPAGGFQELSSKLKLQATDSEGFPTSHTCFLQLNMRHYTSLEEMQTAFTRAIAESRGFGFG